MPRIVVVGSSNTDMVVKTPRIPIAGETVMGGDFVMVPGGKGANQAVAAAKLGVDVTFIASIGADVFGDQSVRNFESVGIVTSYIIRCEKSPSGVALIFVDEKGENVIVVAPGSNSELYPEHIERAKDVIRSADVLVAQLEVPIETVERALEIARDAGVRTILNPAPARDLPDRIYRKVDVFLPNETEAAAYTGMSVEADPVEKGRKLLDKGVGTAVMTLGSKGALIVEPGNTVKIPSPKVNPVDTTAAGDAFTGGLAVAISEGLEITEAARFASKVAAISVTRMGAQTSMPSRHEVDSFTQEPQQ